jgi:predicted nucleotidyltransferase
MSSSGELEAAFRTLAADLPAATSWAVVGGLAVSARAEPRFTRDVDLAVAVSSDDEAEALVASLLRRGWVAAAVVEQQAVDRLAQVRLRSATSGPVVCDLLFASSGIEAEVVAIADVLEIVPGLAVPVARTGHLIALKLLSVDERRLQDRLDLESLSRVAARTDWDEAADALGLITARGFDRGRDLVGALATLRAQA